MLFGRSITDKNLKVDCREVWTVDCRDKVFYYGHYLSFTTLYYSLLLFLIMHSCIQGSPIFFWC